MIDVINKQASRLPLTSRLVFETDDLLAARGHIAKILGQHTIIPTERNYKVSFQHCCINIGRISINALKYGAAIRIGTRPVENTFLLLMLLKGSGVVKQEGYTTHISEHNAYVFNPKVPAILELSRDQFNFTIKIPMSAFCELLENETGRVLVSELEFKTYIPDAEGRATGLRSFIRFLCDEIDKGNKDFSMPLLEKKFEQTILSLILMELPHNYNELMGKEPLEPAPIYIHSVEKFIAENFSDYIRLSKLAEVASVSERVLQNGFRRFRNSTPMEYLRDYRLNIARQKLESIKETDSNITEIAIISGFNHLSKFSKCYRYRFGESPSQTRKRVLDIKSRLSPE